MQANMTLGCQNVMDIWAEREEQQHWKIARGISGTIHTLVERLTSKAVEALLLLSFQRSMPSSKGLIRRVLVAAARHPVVSNSTTAISCKTAASWAGQQVCQVSICLRHT